MVLALACEVHPLIMALLLSLESLLTLLEEVIEQAV